MQKISHENSFPLPRNPKNNEMISFSHDTNNHADSKSKSV